MSGLRRRVVQGALVVLTLTVAACTRGDDPGYQVIVENESGSDAIMVMEGAGFALPDLGGTPRQGFLARHGEPAAAGPWVYVGFDAAGGQKSGRIWLYSPACQAVADFEVKAGTYLLSVDEGGAATIAPYGRNEFPEGTPKLAFAPHDCQ